METGAAAPATWADFLALYTIRGGELFSEDVKRELGSLPWCPKAGDQAAAGKMHVQLVSRIATQTLGYSAGTEQAALTSIYLLFERAREITTAHPDCRYFELLAWDVLNHHVRPFTAKWHRESERGTLAALDATDEFRAELVALQPTLRQFSRVLCHIRDLKPPLRSLDADQTGREQLITQEMKRALPWGIPLVLGDLEEKTATLINTAEKAAIEARRRHYGLATDQVHAAGLALSGGGIRSTTFSMGVLVALAQRGLLPQFDYLSTVSGGGYLGSFLTTYLHGPPKDDLLGLGPGDSPFDRKSGESAPLRHLRHHCRYLGAGSRAKRLEMAAAQIHGMAMNAVGILLVAFVLAALERGIVLLPLSLPSWTTTLGFSGILALIGWFILCVTKRTPAVADKILAASILVPVAFAVALGLAAIHRSFHESWIQSGANFHRGVLWWLVVLGSLSVVGSLLLAFFGRLLGRQGVFFAAWTALAAVGVFFGVYLVCFELVGTVNGYWTVGLIVFGLGYFLLLDVNRTSPHRHYRDALAKTFLIRPAAGKQVESADPLLLSSLVEGGDRAPYHLINCALNVPGTKNSKMQGRLTDFFLFSREFCGSPLTGYHPTSEWEKADRHLNLGTAMAISGAAAAPQMGLGTMKHLSFWLALLNVRLGYWVCKPAQRGGLGPGLVCLLHEMLGNMHERGTRLNVTDGGHIENLGVYELLRRRCKFIVAIDGEQDGGMTFAALTTLQRLAAIDLGVRIDIDLDDLRLGAAGLSRSHFRFARIQYPNAEGYGYLLYAKLSLTGNEGEFIRRYRRDEPVFPHHATADQFFTEAQFEAYRSLGQHVGEKLFLKALVGARGESSDLKIDDWFEALGRSLLEPVRANSV